MLSVVARGRSSWCAAALPKQQRLCRTTVIPRTCAFGNVPLTPLRAIAHLTQQNAFAAALQWPPGTCPLTSSSKHLWQGSGLQAHIPQAFSSAESHVMLGVGGSGVGAGVMPGSTWGCVEHGLCFHVDAKQAVLKGPRSRPPHIPAQRLLPHAIAASMLAKKRAFTAGW